MKVEANTRKSNALDCSRERNGKFARDLDRLIQDLSDFHVTTKHMRCRTKNTHRTAKAIAWKSNNIDVSSRLYAKISKSECARAIETVRSSDSNQQPNEANATSAEESSKIETERVDVKTSDKNSSTDSNRKANPDDQIEIKEPNTSGNRVSICTPMNRFDHRRSKHKNESTTSGSSKLYDHTTYLDKLNRLIRFRIENNTENRKIIIATRRL